MKISMAIGICLLQLLAGCTRRLWSFELRVDCVYIPKYFSNAPYNGTNFIHKSCRTGIFAYLHRAPFQEQDNSIGMQWQAREGETVRFRMQFESLNTSILKTPYLKGVPLEGVVQVKEPNWKNFSLHFPCVGSGQAQMKMEIFYTVESEDMMLLPDCGSQEYHPLRLSTIGDTCSGSATPYEGSAINFENSTESLDDLTSTLQSRNYSVSLTMFKNCPKSYLTLLITASVVPVVCIALVMAIAIAYAQRVRKTAKDTVASSNANYSKQYTGQSIVSRGTLLSNMSEGELMEVLKPVTAEWTRLFDGCLVPSQDVDVGEEIGRGAFGVVSTGYVLKRDLHTSTDLKIPVAIKTMKAPNSIEDVNEFLDEAYLMKDFCDDHVVSLVGVILEESSLPMICLEMMHKGDLRGYLLGKSPRLEEIPRNPSEIVSVIQLLNFCADIASGMTYLAAMKFVHRDLAARNCMLTADLTAKVGDFGLARDVHGGDYYRVGTARPLPVKWMAPECFDHQIFTSQSDVWAFGVTMWEIFSFGASPYSFVGNHEIQEFLQSGHRLKAPALMPDIVQDIMTQCWEYKAEKRPSFQYILDLTVAYIDQNDQPADYMNVHPTDMVGMDLGNVAPPPPPPTPAMVFSLDDECLPQPPSDLDLNARVTFVEPYSVRYLNKADSQNDYKNIVPTSYA